MATTTRARAGSMTHGSFSGVGGSSATASHGLGISHLGPASSSSSSTVVASSQQPSLHLQCKESVFGQGQAHNDGRRSIVALQQHSQHRRSTTTAMRPLLVGGRQSSAGLGQLREDGEEGEGAVDESRLDAEEVLRALSVSEARRVEARLRSVPSPVVCLGTMLRSFVVRAMWANAPFVCLPQLSCSQQTTGAPDDGRRALPRPPLFIRGARYALRRLGTALDRPRTHARARW